MKNFGASKTQRNPSVAPRPSEALRDGGSAKEGGVSEVSIVVTVFNEEKTISSLIKALDAPEIIIVDGGSTDNTLKILKKYKKIKLFQKPGNRSVGRNFGVSKAAGSIIAFTDAGCVPRQNWLEYLTRPFKDHSVSVVSGYYQGVAQNIFQKCLIPFVLVMPDKAELSEFYPATRSMAIRKSVFLKSGGFDEKLAHNEDYAFACKLKSQGHNFVFAKAAMVDWYPRKNLTEAAWMFTRFAIGDIQAGLIRPQLKPLIIRYLIFIYLIFLTPYFPSIFYFLISMSIFYLLYSILKNYKYVKDPRAFFWLPVIQITCDLSILFGSLVGFLSKVWT